MIQYDTMMKLSTPDGDVWVAPQHVAAIHWDTNEGAVRVTLTNGTYYYSRGISAIGLAAFIEDAMNRMYPA